RSDPGPPPRDDSSPRAVPDVSTGRSRPGVATAPTEPSIARLVRTLHGDGWLTWSLATRALAERYRGSTFGWSWLGLYPLALLAIYALVFAGVLKIRFATGTAADFVVFAFCGLALFTMVSESILTSVGVLAANASLIKRTTVRPYVFPLSVT